MPASFVFRTNQGKAYTADTYFIFGKPAPVTINSVVASASPYTYPYTVADVSGTSITNGINYKVLSFTSVSTTTSYTVNYTCGFSTTIYVLAVGGGAGGNFYAGGGGGAGGVVMMPVNIPAGSSTIVVNVGAGGAGVNATSTTNGGSTTTVTFTSNQSANIYAYGGNTFGGSFGGSQGGSSNGTDLASIPKTSNSNNYNYTNMAGLNCSGNTCPGGGGAGTQSCTLSTTNSGGIGGNGIQCFLPGISTFTPSGTAYGTYYWGGGGGGSGSSSGISGVSNGNGGLGGGGGGGSEGGFYGAGGIGGINNGANGSSSSGGSGGANTGSGGGGVWTSNIYSGAGGSGIVVIAFPSATAVTSNQSAVLPASIVSSGLYSATLNNATLSSLAYNTIKGAYACRLLNYNYFGPIMTLRCSTDLCGNYTQNFYSDICGNLGTGYLGTGQSVSTWLSGRAANTTYAYVTKWYNQGMDVSFNCATQYSMNLQPIYDVSNGLLNFGYTTAGAWVTAPQTNCYFNLPNGSLPLSDTSYTFVAKLLSMSTAANVTLISGGANSSGNTLAVGYNFHNSGGGYYHDWFATAAAPIATTVYTLPETITYRYATTGSTTSNYIYVNVNNGATSSSLPVGLRNTTAGNCYLGNNLNGVAASYATPLNSQLYTLYVFNSSLIDSDRIITETTPHQYSPPPVIAGLSASQVTSTTFVLNWSTVSSAQTYALWINGSYFATYSTPAVTTGTVTPTTNGPWTLNLYAYNSANVLLATGSTGAVMMAGANLIANSGATQTTNGTNTVFTFTSSGTFTVATTGYASVLIIGGGGSGGTNWGGGGGAGGLVYFDANYKPMLLTAGTAYTVTVGTGGAVPAANSVGINGTNSVFNGVTAVGGGGGGYYSSTVPGNNGGSGGGGLNATYAGGVSTQSSYPNAYYVGGYSGGRGGGSLAGGSTGGGGGSSQIGGVGTTTVAGNGGNGYSCNITGSSVSYAGGGGGMAYINTTTAVNGGTGGLGGGGNGGSVNNANTTTNATNATGYGSGGGGGNVNNSSGGSGSNGVVIISCLGTSTIYNYDVVSTTGLVYYLPFNNDLLNYASGTGVATAGITLGNSPTFTQTSNGSSLQSYSIYFTNTVAGSATGASNLSAQQYLYFGNSSSPISMTNGITITMWVYLKLTTSNTNDLVGGASPTMIALGNSTAPSTNSAYAVNYIGSAPGVYAYSTLGGAASNVSNFTPGRTPYVNNGWTHYAYCYATGNSYINGVLDALGTPTFNAAGSNITNSSIYPVYIGSATYMANNNPLNGYVSNLRVYTRTLSGTEILTIYNNKC